MGLVSAVVMRTELCAVTVSAHLLLSLLNTLILRRPKMTGGGSQCCNGFCECSAITVSALLLLSAPDLWSTWTSQCVLLFVLFGLACDLFPRRVANELSVLYCMEQASVLALVL